MITIPRLSKKILWRGAAAALAAVALTVSLAGKATTQPEADTARSLQQSFAKVAEQYRPIVVSITTQKVVREEVPQFFFGDPFEFFFEGVPDQRRRGRQPQQYMEHKLEGSGSGVIINADGYVLTNYHVISDADNIRVHVTTDRDRDETYEAALVGKDPYTDLAIVRIKANRTFPAAKLGNSDNLRVGDWVIAIGSPFGLEQTVTAGIVSARRQSLLIEGRRYENMIQTDAAINRGNSGGPLVNIDGELIGINTAIYAPTGVFSGIGFAVPVNKAKEIMKELMEKGRVARGWLGVEIKDVDDAVANQFALREKRGVLLNRVVPGSAAEKSGLQRGDVILEFNGEKIRDARQLQDQVRRLDPGSPAKVVVYRNGREVPLTIRLGTMPDESETAAESPDTKPSAASRAEWRSLTVEALTPQLARRYNAGDEKGVIVTAVRSGNDGIELGLQEGDIIKGINRQAVLTVDDFRKVTAKVKVRDGVVFDIVRNGYPLYVSCIGGK